jgi:hypothetical protein
MEVSRLFHSFLYYISFALTGIIIISGEASQLGVMIDLWTTKKPSLLIYLAFVTWIILIGFKIIRYMYFINLSIIQLYIRLLAYTIIIAADFTCYVMLVNSFSGGDKSFQLCFIGVFVPFMFWLVDFKHLSFMSHPKLIQRVTPLRNCHPHVCIEQDTCDICPCFICYEKVDHFIELPCKHKVHFSCMEKCTTITCQSTCPLCRFDIIV